jgi:hypothetical protein
LCTAGCLAFLAHVACAFHFYYGWSHAAALEATARQTEALLGVRFGAGIYFSYLFGAVWLLDVIRLWGLTGIGRKPPVLVHAYLFFIAFHGAIVFEAGPTRWAGITACLVLAGLSVRRAYNAKSVPRGSPRETVHEDRKASVLSNE